MLILASGLEKRTARQALRMSQFVRRREWPSPLVVSIALVKGRRVPFWDLGEYDGRKKRAVPAGLFGFRNKKTRCLASDREMG